VRGELVEVRTTVRAAPQRLWEVIGAPELYPRFVAGVSSCRQLSAEGRREGANYEVRADLDGTATVVSELTILTFRPGSLLVLSFTAAGDRWLALQLRPVPTGTELSVQVRSSGDELRISSADLDRRLTAAATRIDRYLAGTRDELPPPADTSSVSVARVLSKAGVLTLGRPDRMIRQASALNHWGATIVGGYRAAAARGPEDTAIVDERGSVTFGDLDEQSTRLANGLAGLGVGPGTPVALMCRNHHVLVVAMIACGKLGTDVVLLNTGLSPATVAEVVRANGVAALLADDEFAPHIGDVPTDVSRLRSWPENHGYGGEHTVDGLIAASSMARIAPVGTPGRIVVLTSGTTGVPKGARRPTPRGLSTAAAVLSRIPLRAGEKMLVAAPLFHTWGLAAMQLGMPLRACLYLRRRFDAEAVLRMIDEHRTSALIVVPIMLQRILDLPESVRAKYDTSCLRIVGSSGSALPGNLVTEFMDAFGDVLYNLYGSTEVSWASIADPADLRAAPTTAGRSPLGTRVGVLDDQGAPAPPGADGHLFVGNDMLFDGYTSGASLPVRHRMMATGDRGHLDADGRLFVAGRADEMIVSGGENVSPRPVEEILVSLPQVREAAVVGIGDTEYGQRLAAYLVLQPGARLDADSVRAYVHQRLARFAVPRDVVFVRSLPRNATGKVLKRLLQEGSW
jgi:acyl-CoA synthetase (AMP-forming)/AMP-acid ligase II/uncharacterized protein YndB with AHSA1/START domain